MRPHWIRLDHKSKDRCPYKKREIQRHRQTYKEGKSCEHGEMATTNQGMPRIAGDHQQLGGSKEDP